MRRKAEGLTKTQLSILEFLKEYINENSFPPTVREICSGLNIKSTSTVHTNLKKLTDAGRIKYTPATRRAIVLCGCEQDNSIPVPLIGDVAAGSPITAIENTVDTYNLPKGMLHGAKENEVFMLSVRGDSMIDIGIMHGDMIIVNNALSVQNGDVAVVRVNGDTATCKRFYREKNKIRLQPENSTMQPIMADLDEVEIVGKVIGLYRNM